MKFHNCKKKITVKTLQKLIDKTSNRFEKFVLTTLINDAPNKGNIHDFIVDIITKGTDTGNISPLIDYNNVSQLYETYDDELFDILHEDFSHINILTDSIMSTFRNGRPCEYKYSVVHHGFMYIVKRYFFNVNYF